MCVFNYVHCLKTTDRPGQLIVRRGFWVTAACYSSQFESEHSAQLHKMLLLESSIFLIWPLHLQVVRKRCPVARVRSWGCAGSHFPLATRCTLHHFKCLNVFKFEMEAVCNAFKKSHNGTKNAQSRFFVGNPTSSTDEASTTHRHSEQCDGVQRTREASVSLLLLFSSVIVLGPLCCTRTAGISEAWASPVNGWKCLLLLTVWLNEIEFFRIHLVCYWLCLYVKTAKLVSRVSVSSLKSVKQEEECFSFPSAVTSYY